MYKFWRKIIAGGAENKTRFHDKEGNVVDVRGIKYLPHCLGTTLMRIASGKRPELPWLGYRAIKRIDELIQPDWKVLEFGSGFSTVWLSERCDLVVSIEDDKKWYKLVNRKLSGRKVEYKLRERKNYHKVEGYEDGYFDFALIDGIRRSDCTQTALDKVKKGGYIYLDNSDKNKDAKKIIKENAISEESYDYFIDFAPTYFFVTQGMITKKN